MVDNEVIEAHTEQVRLVDSGLFIPPEGVPRADPCPTLIGNEGMKELMLCALCGLDVNFLRQTAVPLLVVGKSGSGKSTMMEGMKQLFGSFAEIYGVDAVTPAQTKGMVKGTGSHKKIVKYNLATLSLFDEINKWQMNYLEGVLIPAFGAEMGVRVRDGEAMDTSDWACLPIGTLLPHWLDLTGTDSKRIHNIQQIMRRCLLFKLMEESGSESTDAYIDGVCAKMFANVHYTEGLDLEGNKRQITRVVNNATRLLGIGAYGSKAEVPGWVEHNKLMWRGKEEYKAAKKRLGDLAQLIRFSDRVVYDKQFIFSALKLSRGMAARYGRNFVTVDDVERVCAILEAHAKDLEFLQIRCPYCQKVIGPKSRKCPECGEKLVLDER